MEQHLGGLTLDGAVRETARRWFGRGSTFASTSRLDASTS
jgi:hypothetical protein